MIDKEPTKLVCSVDGPLDLRRCTSRRSQEHLFFVSQFLHFENEKKRIYNVRFLNVLVNLQ